MEIYPNPTTGNIFISYDCTTDEKAKVYVFDVYGNLVQDNLFEPDILSTDR